MKNALKVLYSIVLYTIIITLLARGAYAVDAPTFPSCANPQGQIVASYDSGTHGVVGDPTTYSGHDTVYTVSDATLIQCLCADNGQGIQTNWWKASSLTQDQIDVLESQGWILIPDGSGWGLQSGAYLAKNAGFSCGGAQLGGGSSSSGGPGDGLSDGRSDGRSDGHSDPADPGDPAVLGASTGVLGLASTGNAVFILSIVIAGMVLLGLGSIINKKNS